MTRADRHVERRDEPAFGELPDPDGLVVGAGDEALAGRVDDDAADEAGVAPGLDAQERRGGRFRRVRGETRGERRGERDRAHQNVAKRPTYTRASLSPSSAGVSVSGFATST